MLSLEIMLTNGQHLKYVKYHVSWKILHVTIQFLHDCHPQ